MKNYNYKKINIFLELETIDGTPYFESSFGYQILDNNNNNLVLQYNYNPDFVKKMHKTLIKRENFNSNDGFFGNSIKTNGGYSKWIVQDLGNSALWNINAYTLMEPTEEHKLDLSKLRIIIYDIKYKDSNKNIHCSNNNIYEFIIEN